jgi:hypothetical protein
MKANVECIEEITASLLENVAKVRFGEVSISLRIHEGRIVAITHSAMSKDCEIVKTEKGEVNYGRTA